MARARRTPTPYDLTAEPLHRPRATDDRDVAPARRRAERSRTGMSGTAMPGYAGQIPDADLWALADHVVALGAHGAARRRRARRDAIDARSHGADRGRHVAGRDDADEARVFGSADRAAGHAAGSLAPARGVAVVAAVRALSREAGARVAARRSTRSATSLGSVARSSTRPATTTPRAARAATRRSPSRADAIAELRAEGVTCAGCHVRDWVRRGPPQVAPSLLAAARLSARRRSRSTSAATSACRVTSCRRAPRSPASRCSTRTRSGSTVRTCGAASSASTATCRTASTRGSACTIATRSARASGSTATARIARGGGVTVIARAREHRRRPLSADDADARGVAARSSSSTRAARAIAGRARRAAHRPRHLVRRHVARALRHAHPAGRAMRARAHVVRRAQRERARASPSRSTPTTTTSSSTPGELARQSRSYAAALRKRVGSHYIAETREIALRSAT